MSRRRHNSSDGGCTGLLIVAAAVYVVYTVVEWFICHWVQILGIVSIFVAIVVFFALVEVISPSPQEKLRRLRENERRLDEQERQLLRDIERDLWALQTLNQIEQLFEDASRRDREFLAKVGLSLPSGSR